MGTRVREGGKRVLQPLPHQAGACQGRTCLFEACARVYDSNRHGATVWGLGFLALQRSAMIIANVTG